MAAVTAAAYGSSFGGVFVFDDVQWIVENAAIRQAWPPWSAAGGTLRPVLFWSLAVNYAVSGLEPWSYHAVNLLIHVGAALALLGVLRRVLAGGVLADGGPTAGASATTASVGGSATPAEPAPGRVCSADTLAFAAALIWAVHPLTTQAVTYVIQRGESLAGLLVLLVLYCTHRGAASPGRGAAWYAGAVAAFYAGLGTKEVMVAALPVLWAYDRQFLSGSWRAAARARGGLYGVLAGPLAAGGALALLVRPGLVQAFLRGDAVDVTRWEYILSQPGVLLHYLRLCVWPFPQYLDYGWVPAHSWGEIALPALVVAALLAATARAVWRGDRLGFAGVWFFTILAPTSSVVPLKDLLVEHRMYLPLAAVVVLAVLAAGAWLDRPGAPAPRRRALGAVLLVAVVLSLGAATWRRNLDYHSELSLWGRAVADGAGNVKRFYNLGLEFLLEDRGLLEAATFAVSADTAGLSAAARRGLDLLAAGQIQAAATAFERALRQDPEDVTALTGAGIARFLAGDPAGACRWLARVVLLRPDDGSAHTNLSCALFAAGDTSRARSHALRAVSLAPRLAEARHNAGTLAAQTGQWAVARGHLEEALRLRPGWAAARNNLGAVLAAGGDPQGALALYEAAADQGGHTARVNAGLLLLDLRRPDQAAARLAPAGESGLHRQLARKGLCVAAYTRGRLDEAREHGQVAASLAPQDPEAHNNLANCLLALGQLEGALAHYRQALVLAPQQGAVSHNLARALFALGSPGEAARHLERALALDPGDAARRADLAAAREAAAP